MTWPGGSAPCALGKKGVCAAADKSEGDGKTPLGLYPLRQIFYRADRLSAFPCELDMVALTPDMGWCDARADENYNRFVRHPYPASAEHLWREDGLYDVIVTLGHNDDPVVPGKGSAIFLHCCKYDEAGQMKPTLGCVAMPRAALLALLSHAAPQTMIDIS